NPALLPRVNRILMRSANFFQHAALGEHMLQQRIVIEHISLPRMLTQTLLHLRDHAPQPGLRKWIEEKQHDRLGRKGELSCIAANRLDRKTLLRLTPILRNVFLCCAIEPRQEFHAYNAPKGIIGSHQQRSSLARTKIDEDESWKFQVNLFC